MKQPRYTLANVAREARRMEWKQSRDVSLDQRLEAVVAYFGADTPLEAITERRLYDWVAHLEARKGRDGSALSPKTVNRYLSALSGILTYARRVRYTTHNPTFPWQAEQRKRRVILDHDAEAKLLAHLDPHNALCLRVLIATALRPGKEFFGLKASQVEPQWLRLERTKTDDLADVPIPADLSRELRALIEHGQLPTMDEFYRAFTGAVRACGLDERLCPYSLRHTAGTRLARELPGPMVKRFMRHRDYRTTENYIQLGDEDMLRAAAVLSPR